MDVDVDVGVEEAAERPPRGTRAKYLLRRDLARRHEIGARPGTSNRNAIYVTCRSYYICTEDQRKLKIVALVALVALDAVEVYAGHDECFPRPHILRKTP